MLIEACRQITVQSRLGQEPVWRPPISPSRFPDFPISRFARARGPIGQENTRNGPLREQRTSFSAPAVPLALFPSVPLTSRLAEWWIVSVQPCLSRAETSYRLSTPVPLSEPSSQFRRTWILRPDALISIRSAYQVCHQASRPQPGARVCSDRIGSPNWVVDVETGKRSGLPSIPTTRPRTQSKTSIPRTFPFSLSSMHITSLPFTSSV